MLRDKTDDRTVTKFIRDVCEHGDWQLRFYVTLTEDVKDDPDAEPDDSYTYEGAVRDFDDEMLKRDNDVLDILDYPIMQIAEEIFYYPETETLEIYILW